MVLEIDLGIRGASWQLAFNCNADDDHRAEAVTSVYLGNFEDRSKQVLKLEGGRLCAFVRDMTCLW